MRTLKLGLCCVALAATPAAWAACAADSPLDPDTTDDGGAEASEEEDTGALVDTGIDTGKDSGKDSGRDTGIDTGVLPIDSGMDSGPPDPVPGTPCPAVGELRSTFCGFCGTHQTVCEADSKWSAYGFCSGEVVGGCTPGSTRMSPCGKCGTKTEICTSTCAWVAGACTGEPPGACTPGEKKYITAGCVDPETFRVAVCDATCAFGAPSAPPCSRLAADLEISTTLDATVSVDSTLSPLTDQIGRPSSTVGTCPLTVSAVLTSYKYLVIHNPSAQSVVADIWVDKRDVVLDPDIDTMIAIYKPPYPVATADRVACFTKYNTLCNTAPCRTAQSYWPGLAGVDAPTIAPGGTIVVYVAAVSSLQTQTFRLFVHSKQFI